MKYGEAGVMLDTVHGLYIRHSLQNATKHLSNLRIGGRSIVYDFTDCMYDYDDEVDFDAAWTKLVFDYNVERNDWITSTYEIKKKWAACYKKNAFTLDIRSTQLNESFNLITKSSLLSEVHVVQFFKNFEKVVDDKRYKELNHEFDAREKLPRLKMPQSPLLQQLSKIYAPPIFELFQEEFDKFIAACIKAKDESQSLWKYIIFLFIKKGNYKVTFDPRDKSITCSCQKFESVGILCCHALKVYDINDVKILPDHYILHCLKRNAIEGVMHDSREKEIEEDTRLESTRRFQQVSQKLIKLVAQASDSDVASACLYSLVPELMKEVDELRLKEKGSGDNIDASASPSQQVTALHL